MLPKKENTKYALPNPAKPSKKAFFITPVFSFFSGRAAFGQARLWRSMLAKALWQWMDSKLSTSTRNHWT